MKNYTKATIKYIGKHIRKEWKLFVLVILGVSIDKFFGTITPIYYKNLVDAISMGNPELSALYGILGSILIVKLLGWAGRRFFDFVLNRFEPKVMMAMQEENYEYVQRHSYDFFTNNFGGSLIKKINRMTNAFERLTDSFVFNLYPLIFQVVVSLWILFFVNRVLTYILAVWMVFFIVINYFIAKFKQKYNDQMNDMDSKMGAVLADTITNNYNISLFATHKREGENYSKLANQWRKIFNNGWNLGAVCDSILGLTMIFLEIAIFYFALRFWKQGLLTIGDFILIQGLLSRILDSLWGIGKIIRDIGRGMSDAREMVEILETPHEIVDAENAKNIIVERGDIEIKNLNFQYAKSKAVFDNFSLKIESGKRIALVSKSGGGKSTLVKLLLRFYNIPKNSIFIDGQDIMEVTQDSLRRQISLVPQDPILFHRSLAENIAYGRPESTMEEIIEASKKANCHEFITNLVEGYNTHVGERGIKLSGGERQRVAIARAILEDAPILILDEATSALDSESEKLIQEALQELMKKKTTIAIAHRLSTISQMDEIIVMDKGKIAERGKHIDLILNGSSKYKKLWDIQAGGFTN